MALAGLVLLLLFTSLNEGQALKCYSCFSAIGGDCDSPLIKSEATIEDCSDNHNRCLIMNQTVNGLVRIERCCGHEDDCPGNTRVFSQGCSDCSWDLCNSSELMKPFCVFNMLCFLLAKFLVR